jgi:opacity protein-like surface antigen
MKKTTVVLLSVLCLAIAGIADAAPKKKRTRNANRVGAYGVGFIANSTFTSDVTEEEAFAEEILLSLEPDATQNLATSTDDSDIGYHATFGFRFNRYFAAELGLVQTGDTVSRARADMDFGTGLLPADSAVSFGAGGPLISAIGILPINDRFEVFGRAGYMFTSAEREILLRVDGQTVAFGSGKGDSQDLVLGVGMAYHFNVVYSLRLEYLKFDSLGEDGRSGTEDLNQYGLGIVVRF